MPWALLLATSLGTFLVTASGVTRAPFMLEMAHDLGSSLAAVAHLFSLLALSWGVGSIVAGIASDRWGRRPLLVAGVALLGLSMLAIALAGGYAAVAVLTLVGSAGGGAYMGVVFAAVADRVDIAQRGRALGWIINGQSLGLLIAVPAASWIGSVLGWRGVFAGVGAALLALIAALWPALAPARAAPVAGRGGSWGWLTEMANARMIALLAAGVTERLCFAIIAVFMPTFLIASYGISLARLTVPIALIALGNIAGNAAGAKLADMTRARMALFGLASLASAAFALTLFLWRPGLVVSVAAGFAFAFANALGRPAFMAVLSQVPESMRGAVMGLNITCASVGWIGAASLGALMIAPWGFASLGLLAAAVALLGAGLSFIPAVARFGR